MSYNFEYFLPYLFGLIFAFYAVLKIFGGMVNSVDPDQTAPEGAV